MRPAAKILLLESEALPAILRATTEEEFNRDTVLPGWSVRDIVAHCSSAMGCLLNGIAHGFTPEENQVYVEERRTWPKDTLLDELESRYQDMAAMIDRVEGKADAIGIGEWIHGGDIREALGIDDAYASVGAEMAPALLAERSVGLGTRPVAVTIGDDTIQLGVGDPVGMLDADLATFIKLVAGRQADPSRYTLSGVTEADVLLYN